MQYVLSILLLSISVSFAQWQSDVRLTNNLFGSETSYNNARCIAANGDVVHVVWHDYRDGNAEIYYKRSTNRGLNWGTDTRLTNFTSNSRYPSISISGAAVHIVWEDSRDGNNEIYYKRSTDAGINWGADTRLTNNSSVSNYSSIAVSGQFVYIVWEDSRDGTKEIYYKHSTNGGINWSIDTRLSNNQAASVGSSVSVFGQFVHVVWHDYRDGNAEIYYKRSTDSGISWGIDTRLTNDPSSSTFPSVSASESNVYIGWTNDGDKEIYYKRSTDAGVSWGNNTRLTYSPSNSINPSVLISGLAVHVAWYDYRDGNNAEIYYKRSTDLGVSWEADMRLTYNDALSWNPSVSVSGQAVHVVWHDNRDGNYEIYYKRNPTGNPIGIININTEIPSQFSLSQNYPNPFNPATKIKFQIPKSGFVNMVVYDVLGREIAVLVNENLQPGTYEADWDAAGLPSGVYFYRIKTNEAVEVRKMVLAK